MMANCQSLYYYHQKINNKKIETFLKSLTNRTLSTRVYTCRCQHLNYDPSFLHTISLRALYPLIHLYFPVIIQIFLSSVCVYKRETNNFWPSGGLSISSFMNEKILFNFVILICCLCQTFTWWMAFFWGFIFTHARYWLNFCFLFFLSFSSI